MSRSCRVPVVLALVFALPAGAFGQKLDNEKTKFGDRLSKKVNFDAYEGKFGDAVKMLAEKFDLPLVIDRSVGTGGAMAECNADEMIVKLPRLLNVRVDTVLRLTCEQVGAVTLIQPDHIKITDATWALYETGVLALTDPTNPNGGDENPPLLAQLELQKSKPLIKRALVTGVYKNVTLGEIIDDIAETTGATVVVSPTVGDKSKKALTVRFSNTPVDAAVRTLCEMTELGSVEDANVLLVTTPERAAARAKEITDKRKARLAETGVGLGGGLCGTGVLGVGGGLGGGGVGLGGPGGVAVPQENPEIAKLKQQNEELKKQIEELQKAIKK
ncbi:MAG TPA: hypothetical protein VMZ71_13030 [Gemmataceae bacterium]|nr:hypothetical protein [Gemmataceae bacterium]